MIQKIAFAMFILATTVAISVNPACAYWAPRGDYTLELFVTSGEEAHILPKLPEGQWSGVLVTHEASQHPEAVLEAYRNPGKLVVVRSKSRFMRDGPFHYIKQVVGTEGVIYRQERNAITLEDANEAVGSEREFTPLLIILGLGVIAMLMSNVARIGQSDRSVFFALAATVATGVTFAAAPTATTFAVAALATAVAAGIATYVARVPSKEYRVASLIFYVLALATGAIWLIG